MKKFHVLCSGILLMTLIACSVAKVDTTSGKAYAESIKAISDSLSELERQEFFNNLRIVVGGKECELSTLSSRTMTFQEVAGMHAFTQTPVGQKRAKDFRRLNGLSATQVISLGEFVFKEAMERKLYALEANK